MTISQAITTHSKDMIQMGSVAKFGFTQKYGKNKQITKWKMLLNQSSKFLLFPFWSEFGLLL